MYYGQLTHFFTLRYYRSELDLADAYGRHTLLHGFKSEYAKRSPSRPWEPNRRILTQSVQGFSKVTRQAWMTAWRQNPLKRRSLVWCIQEIHVVSADEATALRLERRRMWGRYLDVEQAPTSLWSVVLRQPGGSVLFYPHR